MTTKTTEPTKATRKPGAKRTPAEKITEAKERAACLCGCGAFPSKPKSRFLPGHDAKYHAALKRAEAEKAAPAKAARKTTGKVAA